MKGELFCGGCERPVPIPRAGRQSPPPATTFDVRVCQLRRFWRLVVDRIELAVAEIERLRFGVIERSSASAAEDRNLIAGLVHRAIAIDAFGNSQRRASGSCGGN